MLAKRSVLIRVRSPSSHPIGANSCARTVAAAANIVSLSCVVVLDWRLLVPHAAKLR
jgi:hypothetical protein